MLRGNERVYTEHIATPASTPMSWSEEDVADILRAILLAIDRVQNPDRAERPPVGLRGLNWIVNDYRDGVVIALEIHSASAVAGPIPVDGVRLDALITRAVRGVQPPASTTVH